MNGKTVFFLKKDKKRQAAFLGEGY